MVYQDQCITLYYIYHWCVLYLNDLEDANSTPKYIGGIQTDEQSSNNLWLCLYLFHLGGGRHNQCFFKYRLTWNHDCIDEMAWADLYMIFVQILEIMISKIIKMSQFPFVKLNKEVINTKNFALRALQKIKTF